MLDGAWSEKALTYRGRYYQVEDLIVEPKPLASRARPQPVLYAGGESEAARTLITRACDAYVMHGDPAERVAPKVADLRERRERAGLSPMQYGMAAYTIVRDTEAEAKRELERITNVSPGSPGFGNCQDWIANTQLDQQLSLQDYSVSNRGLRAGLVGTPEQVADRIRDVERPGVGLLLLQCSPQLEETERFAETVMPLVRERRSVAAWRGGGARRGGVWR